MSITSDSYDSNKEYYILRDKFDKRNSWEVWLDKETGLVIREINRGGSRSYITGTEIVKKESQDKLAQEQFAQRKEEEKPKKRGRPKKVNN